MRKYFLKQYKLQVQLKRKTEELIQEKEETVSKYLMNIPRIAPSDELHHSIQDALHLLTSKNCTYFRHEKIKPI